ncbi:hypothetical protein LCGC14_0395310 [marine sediment metagenome]|uniref:DUF2493 domain-containing protein n=1 Tax=marine sediment metagenome TaxID=412755 RepID=A0A0F9VKD1_9ZZZZ
MKLLNKEGKKIKLIIAGSTHIHNREVLEKAIEKYKLKDRIEEVVVGQEPGMAQCGRIWAIENNIPVKRFVRYRGTGNNRRMSMLKRGQMLEYSDALLFITDGIISKADGIKDMTDTTDLEVFIYTVKKEEENV